MTKKISRLGQARNLAVHQQVADEGVVDAERANVQPEDARACGIVRARSTRRHHDALQAVEGSKAQEGNQVDMVFQESQVLANSAPDDLLARA